MSAVFNILLPWPSNLFFFNTLIVLLIFLYLREVVVVHAKDYLTLMATGIKWTVNGFSVRMFTKKHRCRQTKYCRPVCYC